MHILLTNDDGLQAEGLQILKDEMAKLADRVTVVAPAGQRSAASHSLTIGKTLYCHEYTAPDAAVREISVSGTPVDAVKMALEYYLKDDHPDLIISGINDGFNLGSDVLYSGTVSAAMEGPYYQVPAMAVSMGKLTTERCRETAALTREIVEKVFIGGKFPGILNVNIPREGKITLANARVVPQTVQIYHNVVMEKRDLDGTLCYKIVGDLDLTTAAPNSDVACICQGHISLTPLKWQQTAERAIDIIKHYL